MADVSQLTLISPLSGWAMPLDEVPDPVFAGRMLGEGLAIDPTEGRLHAPCDGVLVSVAPTRHAVTMRADNGAEILVHVGIDTVGLKGEGFESHVEAGRRVRTGDCLLRFDLDLIARRAPSLITPLVVTNGAAFEIVRRQLDQSIRQGEFLMELRALEAARAVEPQPGGAAVVRRLRVPLPHGIHARPAALIAQKVREFDAAVTVIAHGRRASAASAVSLMSLGVHRDDEITLEAVGSGAHAVLDALGELIGGTHAGVQPPLENRLGAEFSAAVPPAPGSGAVARSAAAAPVRGAELPGVVASRGTAIGPATFVARPERNVVEGGAGVAREAAELTRARDAVRATLTGLAARESGPRAEIVAAHLEFLDDPALAAAAAEWIDRGKSAGYAWRGAIRANIETLRGLGDARLLERAADLLDLESQVLAALAGEDDARPVALPERAIVLADELLPSQLVALDATRVAGICTARGGPTSHVAILAAAMGKPMLVSAGQSVLAIAPGTPLLLDAERGVLRVDPPPVELAAAARVLEHALARDAAELKAAAAPAMTTDGVRVEVFANIGSAAEAAKAVSLGAEGCGLLRTEFLFLDRHTAPDVAAQTAEYQQVVDAFGGRPVTIRTLDAGADKPIAYLPQPREDNPALGLRGIRTSLRHPELLRTQLEALLEVRPLAQCRVMLPMVAEPGEIQAVRAIVEELAARLGTDVLPALGVMVETPAAALLAEQICEVADFVSIGTNDLTQYALAMDRTHPELAARLDGLHPAVLRLVATTSAAASARGRPVAVCGGLASDPLAVPVLLGLGVHELSVVPGLVPRIKARIRNCSMTRCRALAEHALSLSSAAEVRALVRDAFQDEDEDEVDRRVTR